MQNLPTPIRPLLLLAALLATAVAIAGCGTTHADIARGRALFGTHCGSCHTLAQAATTGELGPNLDDAFAAARESGGFDAATVEGIVKAQVDDPRPSNGNPHASMPSDTAEGQDLDDIAAYLGKYAGVPGAAPPEVEGGAGAQVFSENGCGSCPNLDEVLPGQQEAEIEESIVEPNAKIAQGYPAHVMPETFGEKLSEEELKELVEYLAENAGKE